MKRRLQPRPKAKRRSSPARATAARTNGTKGGRKRDRIPADVVARLGAIPKDDPKALDLWVQRVLAELVVLVMEGKVSAALAASIRATCGEIRRNLGDVKPKSAEDDPDDDFEGNDGPALEEVDGVGLRVEH